jgi:type IV pilus assembly protein PilE
MKSGNRRIPSTSHRSAGFTLIETMVTMGIIALLTMVAYPSFVQSLRNSNRSDAQAAIARVSVNLERFFATNGTYTANSGQLGLQMDEGNAISDANHYVISVAAGPTGIASSYVITATASADSGQVHDEGCTTLSLDSVGQRLPDPNDSRCW